MTVEKIQNLQICTLNMCQPFDVPFNATEAAHIEELLSNPLQGKKVCLTYFSREGFDGETFRYAAFRRKDGTTPKQKGLKRVYEGGFIEMGFLETPRASRDLVNASIAAGITVDSRLR